MCKDLSHYHSLSVCLSVQGSNHSLTPLSLLPSTSFSSLSIFSSYPLSLSLRSPSHPFLPPPFPSTKQLESLRERSKLPQCFIGTFWPQNKAIRVPNLSYILGQVNFQMAFDWFTFIVTSWTGPTHCWSHC